MKTKAKEEYRVALMIGGPWHGLRHPICPNTQILAFPDGRVRFFDIYKYNRLPPEFDIDNHSLFIPADYAFMARESRK